jgi:hypothetical protein
MAVIASAGPVAEAQFAPTESGDDDLDWWLNEMVGPGAVGDWEAVNWSGIPREMAVQLARASLKWPAVEAVAEALLLAETLTHGQVRDVARPLLWPGRSAS